MTGLFSPDTVEGFDELRPIDRAVMLKEYVGIIEEEEKRVKALIEDLCIQAKEQNDTDTDEWKLVVRYASGKSMKPDVSMLAAEYPAKYKLLYDEQVKAFKPSMSKSDIEWLFSDYEESERETVVSKIMIEHLVKTQYVLQAKKEGSQ